MFFMSNRTELRLQLQRRGNARLVVDEEVRDDLGHAIGGATRRQFHQHLVAVNGNDRRPSVFEQQPGQHVRRTGAEGVVDRRVPLVGHTGQGTVRLETDETSTSARLFGDGDQLTHGPSSLRSEAVSDHETDPNQPNQPNQLNHPGPAVTLSMTDTGVVTLTDDGSEQFGWSLSHMTRNVPMATIMTTIMMVLATAAVLILLSRTTKIITWVLISAFFAVVLTPAVNFLVKLKFRRALATSIVFLLGIAAIGGLGYLFIRPLAEQGTSFANKLPTYVADAEKGKGPAGKLVKRYKLDDWLEKNKDELQSRAQKIFEPKQVLGVAVGTVGTVFATIAAVLTVGVLTFLMLLQGHGLLEGATHILRPDAQERLHRIGRQCARAINGYVNGNLAISVIAGLTTWIFLLIAGVPFAGVLALWVAFADLIPLVGATLGAIPTVGVAFLHSTTAGVATLIFYVIYQQIENHILQPTIMSRTVALQPLVVLISVLIGVELFGLLGALLAIPVAGIVKVIAADILAHRRPDLLQVERRIKKRHRRKDARNA